MGCTLSRAGVCGDEVNAATINIGNVNKPNDSRNIASGLEESGSTTESM